NLALNSTVRGKFYDSEALGNIAAVQDVPYVEISATRNDDGSKLVVSILNRHPSLRTYVNIDLKDFPKMQLSEGWLLTHPDPLAANSVEQPENVKSRQIGLPDKRGSRFRLDLPPLSVSILSLKKL
ncbi:MAG: alpha-L-arabinofuranosidase C-terminal domain-containing protein, partial [Anaerolineaceae bacterium]